MNDKINWKIFPEKFEADVGDIHIIRLMIPEMILRYKEFWALLTSDEQARAERFKFQEDRSRCVLARGGLRFILSRFLSQTPETIYFDTTRYGKLFLLNKENDLEFNVSHSHECIVYAVTKTMPIGVDVEFPKNRIDFLGIAERFFSKQEFQMLATLNETERPIGFYNAWTRKEAYIKAIGEGLSHPLDTFHVSLLPHESARFLSIDSDPSALSAWTLQAFCPMPGYFGAFASKQVVKKVEYWTF